MLLLCCEPLQQWVSLEVFLLENVAGVGTGAAVGAEAGTWAGAGAVT